MENVVSLETNVKQVLQKVSLSEVEAGLVYVTDVTSKSLCQPALLSLNKMCYELCVIEAERVAKRLLSSWKQKALNV